MGRGFSAAAAVTMLAGSVFFAAPTIQADEGAEVPAFVAPTRVYVRNISPAEGHTFSFYVLLNTCPGPPLKLDHTEVVERPKPRFHRGAAVVTAYLFHHAYREVAVCPPEAPIRKLVRVRTKRPAADLVFFDGSSSPPRRIWPPVKSGGAAHRRSHPAGR